MHQHTRGISLELPDKAEKAHFLLDSLMQGFQATPPFVIHVSKGTSTGRSCVTVIVHMLFCFAGQ